MVKIIIDQLSINLRWRKYNVVSRVIEYTIYSECVYNKIGIVRNLTITLSNCGTMLAMLRTTKASPGWKSNTCEGHTRESEHANTINCNISYKLRTCMLGIKMVGTKKGVKQIDDSILYSMISKSVNCFSKMLSRCGFKYLTTIITSVGLVRDRLLFNFKLGTIKAQY